MARILLRSPQPDTSVPAQTVRCFGPNNFARVPRRAESHSESENTYQPRNSDSLHHHLCSREGLGRDRPEQSISQQQLQLAAEQKRIQPDDVLLPPLSGCAYPTDCFIPVLLLLFSLEPVAFERMPAILPVRYASGVMPHILKTVLDELLIDKNTGRATRIRTVDNYLLFPIERV